MPITETKKIKNTSDVGKLMEKVESKVQKIVDDISDLKAKYESISNKHWIWQCGGSAACDCGDYSRFRIREALAGRGAGY